MTADALAILGGTGPQGRGLAARFARAGAAVTIGSRDAERAHTVAAELGLGIAGAANAEAAQSAEIVFVAVPWDAHEPTLRSLGRELAGRIVVDLVNPMVFDERGPMGVPVAEGSAAEQAQTLLPDSIVVSGFHHVSAKLLLDESADVDEDIMICGDHQDAKERVLTLAELLPGVRAIDTGPLRLAAFLEGMTCVLLSVNRRYRATTGIRLTRFDPARRRPS